MEKNNIMQRYRTAYDKITHHPQPWRWHDRWKDVLLVLLTAIAPFVLIGWFFRLETNMTYLMAAMSSIVFIAVIVVRYQHEMHRQTAHDITYSVATLLLIDGIGLLSIWATMHGLALFVLFSEIVSPVLLRGIIVLGVLTTAIYRFVLVRVYENRTSVAPNDYLATFVLSIVVFAGLLYVLPIANPWVLYIVGTTLTVLFIILRNIIHSHYHRFDPDRPYLVDLVWALALCLLAFNHYWVYRDSDRPYQPFVRAMPNASASAYDLPDSPFCVEDDTQSDYYSCPRYGETLIGPFSNGLDHHSILFEWEDTIVSFSPRHVDLNSRVTLLSWEQKTEPFTGNVRYEATVFEPVGRDKEVLYQTDTDILYVDGNDIKYMSNTTQYKDTNYNIFYADGYVFDGRYSPEYSVFTLDGFQDRDEQFELERFGSMQSVVIEGSFIYADFSVDEGREHRVVTYDFSGRVVDSFRLYSDMRAVPYEDYSLFRTDYDVVFTDDGIVLLHEHNTLVVPYDDIGVTEVVRSNRLISPLAVSGLLLFLLLHCTSKKTHGWEVLS